MIDIGQVPWVNVENARRKMAEQNLVYGRK